MKPDAARVPPTLLAALGLIGAGCSSPEPPLADGDYLLTAPQAFLWTYPHPKLALEFHVAQGLGVSPLALDALVESLTNLTAKPVVAITNDTMTGTAAEKRGWTSEELRRVSAEHSLHGLGPQEYGHGEFAVLHVYYLKGHYASPEGGTKLGVEIDGRAFLFFASDSITHARPLMEQKSERHILIHEIGHALGLVNSGIPMVRPHEDPSSRGHSNNIDSVMSATEITISPTDPMRIPEDRTFVYTFDADDLADVAAFKAMQPTDFSQVPRRAT